MMQPAMSNDWVIPERYWRWVGTRSAAVALLWVICLAAAAQRLHHARTAFDDPPDTPPDLMRADGNSGHTQIDFGGQWVMGRMIATGRGQELYHRGAQWSVVWEGFPPSDESPYSRRNVFPHQLRDPDARGEDIRHDAEWLMSAFMGDDSPRWREAAPAAVLPLAAVGPYPNPLASAALLGAADDLLSPELAAEVSTPAVGGPLYPPVHAILYSPLGLIDEPRRAYCLFQYFTVGLTFVAGLGVSTMCRGRVWWPAATLVILLYPGYRSGLDLAQNHVVSLTILVWGWMFATRGRDGIGGMVWGFLAFKPVWAAAFFLVPLLMGRWRFCLAMLLTGAVLAAATLPFVGVKAWFEWLEVGRMATEVYSFNKNWIGLSRDLFGIPRRLLTDFNLPEQERASPAADVAGWVLWVAVFVPTVAVYLWRADRRLVTGLGAGFLFLGAYLCCYRFMYYDVLLSVLPLALLLADPARLLRATVFDLRTAAGTPAGGPLPTPAASPDDPLRPRWVGYVNSFPLTILAGLLLIENWLLHFQLEAAIGIGYLATTASDPTGGTVRHLPKLPVALTLYEAWETFLLLALWGWCLWGLVAGRDRGEPAYPETPRSSSSAAPTSGDRISDSPTSTA
jgi:arabinofuranan 3-O-arabinosyltransferase